MSSASDTSYAALSTAYEKLVPLASGRPLRDSFETSRAPHVEGGVTVSGATYALRLPAPLPPVIYRMYTVAASSVGGQPGVMPASTVRSNPTSKKVPLAPMALAKPVVLVVQSPGSEFTSSG